MSNLLLAARSETDWAIIADLMAILASAAVVAIVMQRMRLAAIPAYLIAGTVVGPNALGLVPASEGLGAISHLAIILLMFGIGLALHLSVLKHRLIRLIAAGVASCLLCVVVGWPVAMLFGLSAPAGLAVAMALSLSSTAVVLRIIADRRELGLTHGRLALSILIVQDLIVLGMMASLPALRAWADAATSAPPGPFASSDTTAVWWNAIFTSVVRILVAVSIVVVGRLLIPPLLRESLKGRSQEVLMIVSVAIALAAAICAQAIGFSLEMGAFLAGFVFAGTPFRHHLSGQVAPLRDLFIAVFFTTLGMKLNPAVALEWWWVILLGGAIMTGLKAVVISGTCWALGSSASVAIAVGLALAQAGEFSLIVLGSASASGIISDATLATVIAIVVISLILTPAFVDLGGRLARATLQLGSAPWIGSPIWQDPGLRPVDASVPETNVIVAGYGPIGALIVEELERAGIACSVVELNPTTVDELSRRGRNVVFGDVGNLGVLESAGIETAAALILTIPDEEAVLRTCAVARRRAPSIFIAARARVLSKMVEVVESGADSVTVDETSAAREMLEAVTQRLRADSGFGEPPN